MEQPWLLREVFPFWCYCLTSRREGCGFDSPTPKASLAIHRKVVFYSGN